MSVTGSSVRRLRHRPAGGSSSFQAVIEEIDGAEGGIDVSINNAGIFHVVPMVETDLDSEYCTGSEFVIDGGWTA